MFERLWDQIKYAISRDPFKELDKPMPSIFPKRHTDTSYFPC